MDNFMGDQAKAIWDALDTMLKEDPQAYRKFISEQLEEGRQMMEKEKLEKKSGSSEAAALGKMFSGMNIGGGQKVKKEESSSTTTSKSSSLKKDKKLSGRSGEGDACTCGPQLLDDEIGKKSILTQIVKGKGDDEENGGKLSELKIPQVSTGPSSKKKMPLIQEL